MSCKNRAKKYFGLLSLIYFIRCLRGDSEGALTVEVLSDDFNTKLTWMQQNPRNSVPLYETQRAPCSTVIIIQLFNSFHPFNP